MSTGFGGSAGPGGTGELPIVDEPSGPGGGLSPQARRRWYSAIGATAALALLAGGAAALVPRHRHPITQLVVSCGLVNCGATLPGAIVTTSPSGQISTARPHHPAHRPASPFPPPHTSHHATPAASPTPSANPKPTPTSAKPPPAPDVAVTYSVDGKSWWDHFRVYLTIVNRSSQTVSGWTIRLTLPGDRVDWVGYRQGWRGNSFSSWNFSGKTLTLTANSGGEALGPGASQTLTIDARGNTRSPSGCVFNGAACHS